MCRATKSKINDELLSVAQEIAFAKSLAANDKSLRDRALKKLRKWLSLRSLDDSSGISKDYFLLLCLLCTVHLFKAHVVHYCFRVY